MSFVGFEVCDFEFLIVISNHSKILYFILFANETGRIGFQEKRKFKEKEVEIRIEKEIAKKKKKSFL